MSFAQEINVMKNLRHENIVRYLGIQLEDKCLNIFLEYVKTSTTREMLIYNDRYIAGGSISTLLGKFMKFPEPVIRVYTKQILQGIAYLHENHIMHRDIKGANILVDVNVRSLLPSSLTELTFRTRGLLNWLILVAPKFLRSNLS
jgi:serine/threonine protein kinase